MKIIFLNEDTNINEEELLEDKQVKFGGEVNPKYGWCVIYAGGPASGKSSMQNFNIPINGKKLDVDEFKELESTLEVKTTDNTGIKKSIEPGFVKKFMGGKYYNDILNDPRIGGDESKMSLNNPDYPPVANEILDPFLDKVKDSIKTVGANNAPDRLPNIIFDQNSKNINKLLKLIDQVKQYGYKVAIVWVLTDMEKNLQMFYKRGKQGRKLPMSLFMDINPRIITSMKKLFANPQALESIDDFWVIINEYAGQSTDKQKLAQTRKANVYHVPLEPDGLEQVHLITNSGNKKDKTLMDIINDNEEYLNFLMDEKSQEKK